MNFLPWFSQRKRSKQRETHRVPARAYTPWWRTKSFSGGLVTGLLCIAVFIFVRSDVFIIKTVNASVDRSLFVWDSSVRDVGADAIGSSIFTYKTGPLVEQVKASFPQLANVTVEKQLPDTLVIEAEEHQPVVSLIFKEDRYLIEKNGLVYGKMPSTVKLEVPEVEFKHGNYIRVEQEIVGQRLPEEFLGHVEQILGYDWKSNGITLKQLLVFDQYYELICESPLGNNGDAGTPTFIVRVGLQKPLEELFQQMVIVLNKVGQENRKLELLDLRFQTPVVRFK